MSSKSRDISPLDEQCAASFPDNTVINSRYTLFNFIFKNLYEQFRRPLNFYFLLVAMLQFISIIAPVNPMSTLLPLLFAFSLTAVKEGYDDVKRHRQDRAYNTMKRLVLDRRTGQWRSVMNSEIRVGDVILLHQNEEIPCDCLVLAAPTTSVFIRTDNLDGEIDLKPRDVVAPAVELCTSSPTMQSYTGGGMISSTPEGGSRPGSSQPCPPPTFFSLDDDGAALLEKLSCLQLHCPPPSSIVDLFDGVAEFARRELVASPVRLAPPQSSYPGSSAPTSTAATGAGDPGGEDDVVRVSLSHRHLLPQSCLLKNTEKAICVAVYTGNETKCGMNKRPPPVKWAKIDKDVSRYSIFIFCCQMVSALSFGVAGYMRNNHVEERFWYLPQPASERTASFLIYPLRFFLLTTVMIPVSFKFVVDMSKYYMALSVEWDEAMVHGELGGCKVNNSSILEDLGQIDYVLSDKTGTMTQNVMELQCISVVPDTQVYLGDVGLPPSVYGSPTVAQAFPVSPSRNKAAALGFPRGLVDSAQQQSEVGYFACLLALCNTVEVTPVASAAAAGSSHDNANVFVAPQGSITTRPDEGVSYQAASPDEVALCCGAAKLNVVLYRRTLREAVLRVGPDEDGNVEDEVWIFHHVFMFSSERKAMGVIVEHKQRKRILVIVKGADDSVAKMLKRGPGAFSEEDAAEGSLQQSWQETYPAMAEHLHSYAKRGLRTLLVAQRELEREELNNFLMANRAAELAMENRQEKVDALRTALETDLDLIGITAIEDKLQEHVQGTIGDILAAGMMMWMLTGDKVETAEQIGLSCGLYGPQDRVIRVVEGDTEDTRDAWEEVLLKTDLPPLRGTAAGRSRESGGARTQRRPQYTWSRLPPEEKQARLAQGRRMIQRVRALGSGSVETEESDHGVGGAAPTMRVSSPPEQSLGTADEGAAVLIVQGGHVLERIFSTAHLAARFAELSRRCISVICARTTPSQKAMITQFVRQQGMMTLSVGDGGNDVSMIQEAHVGVGIVGKEGQQAARAADFAITQFSDLRQLLFVHGQQAYVRTAYVIKYSFYKSMLISFIQLAYNTRATYVSGGTFWNSFALTMWNGVYTLPQTLFYCLDRFAPRVVLERCPSLYKMTRRAVDMDVKEFFGWYVVRGIVQSVALLYLVSETFGGSFAFGSGGYAGSHDIHFTVAYTALILSQLITVLLESHSVTWLNVLWLVGMPVFYLLSTLAYSDVPALQYFGVLRKTLAVEFWLAALAMAVALTAPVVALQGLKEAVWPNARDVLRTAELKRQRVLLKQRSYRVRQSLWVRLLGCTPEAPSPSLDLAAAAMKPANRRHPPQQKPISSSTGSVGIGYDDSRTSGPRDV